MEILKEVEMFVFGAVVSAILVFVVKWISKKFLARPTKRSARSVGAQMSNISVLRG